MNNDLSAWGPTLVTVLGWIFFGGVMWARQQSHEKRLNDHDDEFEDVKQRTSANELEIVKVNSWKEGYNAARATYDRKHVTA